MTKVIIAILLFVCAVVATENLRDRSQKDRLNAVLKAQLDLSMQHIIDLQHVNHQLASGNIDTAGNPVHKVNLDTLKYASFCEGYNQAVEHIGKNYSGTNGYVLGYHAAIGQERQSENEPLHLEDDSQVSKELKNAIDNWP